MRLDDIRQRHDAHDVRKNRREIESCRKLFLRQQVLRYICCVLPLQDSVDHRGPPLRLLEEEPVPT
jgi:hypothetical protein